MSVVTTVLPLRLPFRIISSAQMAMTLSPSTISPASSQKITLSASPSRAMPRSAPVSRTRFFRSSGLSEPQSVFMFLPSGFTPIVTTSAPSSWNMIGETLYPAPLAQSRTILIPSSVRFGGKEFLANTTYLPGASSILCALPMSPGEARSWLLSPFCISSSMRISSSSGSLYPYLSNIFMPLSS